MKEIFKWYFPPTQKEIQSIWKNGILTVDTNVLLDVYRYHQNTRKALLDSLKGFKGRAWLSYQVADEFFRNRNNVILSATGAFNDAERYLLDVRKAIEDPLNKLKGSRIIPDNLEEELEASIVKALDDADQAIKNIRMEYPDYRKEDPILDSICSLFKNSVGTPVAKEDLSEILKEAKRRKENKIPPGYKDSNKDGDKPYGDYIIWRQIMDYVKKENKPLIFVTSEQKEDWWEKASGKTTGPLYELLKEFYEETGQRFLFYRTDRFLEYSSEKVGKKANSNAVEEIRDVALQRQRETPVVKVLVQTVRVNELENASGTLKIQLLESVRMFTCSGHFDPAMSSIPQLEIKLTGFPIGTPNHIIRSGTGTNFDFNIHLKTTNSTPLPAGEYIFEYTAIVN